MQEKFPWGYLMGANFLEREDREWLIKIMERWAQVEPDLDRPHLILGGLYSTISEEKALNYWREAIRINPDNEEGIVVNMGIQL